MSELREDWYDWCYDSRGYHLVNDPEITFDGEEDATAYCDEHNRALIGQAAIRERERIVAIIITRISIINRLINGLADNHVKVPDELFNTLAELRLLLRELQQ